MTTEVFDIKRNPYNKDEFVYVIGQGTRFYEVDVSNQKIKKTDELIKFDKEDIAELMWLKEFQERELLLINLSSTEPKTKSIGRLIIYNRELKKEVAVFTGPTFFNIKQFECPDIKQKEHEITFSDGRTIHRTIDQ